VTDASGGVYRVPFVKASACGNDFLLVEERFAPADLADLTRRACDRHEGVGADGVEWLSEDDEADIAARLINADGSPAEISGNGTRCVAALLASAHEEHRTFSVRTGAGVRICELIMRQDPEFAFAVDMWAPQVGEPEAIPLSSGPVTGTAVSTGNPHFVVLVDEFVDGWQAVAAELEAHPRFPQRTNVELVRVVSPGEVEARLFERGAGETLSSGTGSVAAAVAAIAAGRARSPVRVLTPGGAQTVIWDGSVTLRGSARLVCAGSFYW
jgi:diaminopimelate epimerase